MNLKIFTDNIEDKAKEQIDLLLAQPAFSDCKVRIMPDVHAGAGCVIGFTADLGKKVIPNIVGVDIGCGVLVIPLGKVNIDFAMLDQVIRSKVPSGMNVHNSPVFGANHIINFDQMHLTHIKQIDLDRVKCSLGTLGGGNHFIEIDEDDEENKYLVIHSGSRNLGKQVCEFWQAEAVDACKGCDKYNQIRDAIIRDCKNTGREKDINKELKQLKEMYDNSAPKMPNDLCYLDGRRRDWYLNDMRICQLYADWNRTYIARSICNEMGWNEDHNGRFTTMHNYIDMRDNIVRKGAVSARNEERLIIPINMHDGSLLCRGKGNPDWNFSAPHGAGRLMSRSEARKSITMEEYKKSMEGVYTTSVDETTIDESPMAYKSMDEIARLIEPTVHIDKKLKARYNYKAGETFYGNGK